MEENLSKIPWLIFAIECLKLKYNFLLEPARIYSININRAVKGIAKRARLSMFSN
jgi:hypothetical protein|tara:strand:- start:1154 stop:1318 length:165 start_codon:yes stop_codon:yes gene_type:complete